MRRRLQQRYVNTFEKGGMINVRSVMRSFSQAGVSCRLRAITANDNGVYVAGSFTGGPFTLDTGFTLTNLNTAGSEEILAFKLDTSGNTQWASR